MAKKEAFSRFKTRMEVQAGRGKPMDKYFALRKKLEYAFHSQELMIAGTLRHRTLGAMAYRMGIFASVLYQFAWTKTEEELEKRIRFYNATPNAIVRAIGIQSKFIRKVHQEYVRSGINPQSKITVLPYYARTKKALELWRARSAAGRRQLFLEQKQPLLDQPALFLASRYR